MRWLTASFLVVFFALSVLPLVVRFGKFEAPADLHGAVAPPEHVALSARSYLDGSFQKAFEGGFDGALGLRSRMIRFDNELNFRAFKEFAPSVGTTMVLGKKGFVYERWYVDAYNRRGLVPISLLAQKVQRLKLLQDYLAARSTTFLVVVSPNKARLYAENLPSRFVFQERLTLPDNYSVFVGLLQKYGVSFIDVQAQMVEAKASSAFPLFSNAGAHWNDPWACDVTAQIQRFIQQASRRPTLGLRCEPVVVREHPEGSDRDLADLANLWFEEELFRPTPYARANVFRPAKAERPSVLFVGSSYLLQILWYENHYGLQQHDTFYYYYKTRVAYPNVTRIPLDPSTLDWQGEVFGKQAVVIEINAAVVEHVGWGFLEDAERVLNGGQPAPRAN